MAHKNGIDYGGVTGGVEASGSSNPITGIFGAIGHWADTHGGLLPDSTGIRDIAHQYGAPVTTVRNAVAALHDPAGAVGASLTSDVKDAFHHPAKHLLLIGGLILVLILVLKK